MTKKKENMGIFFLPNIEETVLKSLAKSEDLSLFAKHQIKKRIKIIQQEEDRITRKFQQKKENYKK